MVPETFSGKPEISVEQGRTRVAWDTARAVKLKVVVPLYMGIGAAIGAVIPVFRPQTAMAPWMSAVLVALGTAALIAVGLRFPRRVTEVEILGFEDPVALGPVVAMGQRATLDPRLVRTVRVDEVVRHKVRRRYAARPGTPNSVVSYDVTVAGESGTDCKVASGFLKSSYAAELRDLLVVQRDAAAQTGSQVAPAPSMSGTRSMSGARSMAGSTDDLKDGELVIAIPPRPRWLIAGPCGVTAGIIVLVLLASLVRGDQVDLIGLSILMVMFLACAAVCFNELRRRVNLTVRPETIDIEIRGGIKGPQHQSIRREDTVAVDFVGSGGLVTDGRFQWFNAISNDQAGNRSRLAWNLDHGHAGRLHDALRRFGWPAGEIVVAPPA